MPVLLIASLVADGDTAPPPPPPPPPPGPVVVVDLLAEIKWRVEGFLELSQMVTYRVLPAFIDFSTSISYRIDATPPKLASGGTGPGFNTLYPAANPPPTPADGQGGGTTPPTIGDGGATAPSGNDPASGDPYDYLLDLEMTAGGMPVESFDWSAERGQGTQMNVTVIGDARGAAVPTVSVQAGPYAGSFAAAGTLPEWEFERSGGDASTTLHSSNAKLRATTILGELVPWESQEEKDAAARQEEIERIAKIPVAQRASARRDGRRMPVDLVVMQALATVRHRLLAPPPFPGYDFRADGGPSYSTAGKTADEVVNDIWGKVGYQAAWEDGVLVVRAPGPTGDVILAAPIESERIEYITLDTPIIELSGGTPAAGLKEDAGDGTGTDGTDGTPDSGTDGDKGADTGTVTDENGNTTEITLRPDPANPDDPENSSDPDERGGDKTSGFVDGVSPTPSADNVAAGAVSLSWEPVPGATQYVLEKVYGKADFWTLWSQLTITTGTRYTDTAVGGLGTYSYRLRVNYTAYSGTEQNIVYSTPSDVLTVTTPPYDAEGVPGAVTDLQAYMRTSSAFGIQWKAPEADPLDAPAPRKPAADRYHIQVLDEKGNQVLNLVETETWKYISGLPAGGKFTVNITAANGAVKSDETVTAEVQLVNLPPAGIDEVTLKPQARTTKGTYGSDTSTFMEASWKIPTGSRSFLVYYALAPVGRAEDSLEWKTATAFSNPETVTQGDALEEEKTARIVLTDLAFNTRYAVKVRAENEVGPGAWSPIAYEITGAAPARPEPDKTIAGFEKSKNGFITISRKTDSSASTTKLWKQDGVVTRSEVQEWANIPLFERDWPASTRPPSEWIPTQTVITQSYFELPEWPLCKTASFTEKVTFDRSLARRNQISGREQERVQQEWSPSGFLNRRTTERTKIAWVIAETADDGTITGREMGSQREFEVETWFPIGNGLWHYLRTGTTSTLAPVWDKAAGGWTHMETVVKPLEMIQEISENPPELAKMPDKDPRVIEPGDDLPALTRNLDSPALGKYPLDEPWFKIGDGKSSGDGNSGPTASGGDEPQTEDDDDPPAPTPGPDDDTHQTPYGSNDTSGEPAPEPFTPAGGGPSRPEMTYQPPTAGGGGGGGVATTTPKTPPADGTPNPDGTYTLPDGSIWHPDGSITRPDGSVVNPDGSTTNPDGTTTPAPGKVITDPEEAAEIQAPRISETIPWITTATGLAKAAAILAQQGGPRYRITRTYILPAATPGLDEIVSASASGSAGNFSLTVVTETRNL